MRRFIPLIFALLIASAALGWMRAGTSAGTRAADVDGWNALNYAPLSRASYAKMAARLKSAQLLPLSRIEEKILANGGGPNTAVLGSKNTPPFPRILGYSLPHVLTEGPDKTTLKFKKGDVLDSGWEIKTVDRKRVIAVFDGEDFEFPIIAYLKEAFEKPDGDGDDDKTNAQNTTSGGE